jgi:SNF2 family DNA or RNA helicase
MCKTKALRDFRAAQSKTRVMLLNSSANAAGTNLIEATHVLLVDPAEGKATERHATEQQAIGRAYRQGQKKSIEVVRFYIKDTVEHDIVNELIETKKR